MIGSVGITIENDEYAPYMGKKQNDLLVPKDTLFLITEVHEADPDSNYVLFSLQDFSLPMVVAAVDSAKHISEQGMVSLDEIEEYLTNNKIAKEPAAGDTLNICKTMSFHMYWDM